MKSNKKGFTLIELLAVIIILGVLLLIAVPAVSKYIENSRKNTYINSVSSIVSAVTTSVNNLEYPLPRTGEGVIIPFEDVELEKGNANTRSPYAPYVEGKSYVIVTYEDGTYHYYVATLDESGFAIPLIEAKKLSTSSVTTDANVITKNVNSLDDIITPDAKGNYKTFGTDSFAYTYKSKSGDFIKVDVILGLSGAVLRDNVAYADNVASPYVTASTGIDFTKPSSDTNGKGLYYTSTNTEDNKTTYYFRGDVQNNYVKFGKYLNDLVVYSGKNRETEWNEEYKTLEECKKTCDGCQERVYAKAGDDIYWRIIRINEDGSIRMIYQGIETKATGYDATIGRQIFNMQSFEDNAYLGYMYGTPSSGTYELTHENKNNSTIKTHIDNWYSTKTNLSLYLTTHLSDSGFCNDRSVTSGTGVGTIETIYGGYGRIYANKKTQFACPNEVNDLFTTRSATKGNKSLKYPIGTITADEVIYAGGGYKKNNKNYYLYTGNWYWTMTPYYFNSDHTPLVFDVGSEGYLNDNAPGNILGVRPVINLKSNVEMISGDGTQDSPYVIK